MHEITRAPAGEHPGPAADIVVVCSVAQCFWAACLVFVSAWHQQEFHSQIFFFLSCVLDLEEFRDHI